MEASRRKLQTAAFARPFAAPAHRFSGRRDWLNGGERKNLVKAASLSAQSVRGAFAIVKAMGREDLGIIKKRRICSEKFSGELKGIFRDKAPRKNYLRANFHGLAYNFYGHIRQFFRSYKIVGPLKREKRKSLRSSSFCCCKCMIFLRFRQKPPSCARDCQSMWRRVLSSPQSRSIRRATFPP